VPKDLIFVQVAKAHFRYAVALGLKTIVRQKVFNRHKILFFRFSWKAEGAFTDKIKASTAPSMLKKRIPGTAPVWIP
jgi:hypothetical protein